MQSNTKKKFPVYGWIGLIMIAVFWTLIWSMPGYRTDYSFFPLWLGYIITVDALVKYLRGSSLLSRNKVYFVLLFVISIPAWWLFELFNSHLQNWHYLGSDHMSKTGYILLSSLDFSTVIPAIFETAELVASFKWFKKASVNIKIGASISTQLRIFVLGILMLIALLFWPNIFFPLVWLSVYFILEPINVWLNNRHLVSFTSNKDWRPLLTLFTGVLITGFFWETWNYYAYPKWIYSLPYVEFFKVYEMPILGYLGYIPFSLELFAIYHLVMGIFTKDKAKGYLRIHPAEYN